jgi:hypothetical protein
VRKAQTIRIIKTNNNNSTTPLTYLTAPGCLQTLLTTEVGKKECRAAEADKGGYGTAKSDAKVIYNTEQNYQS